jgi:hypothetical protein
MSPSPIDPSSYLFGGAPHAPPRGNATGLCVGWVPRLPSGRRWRKEATQGSCRSDDTFGILARTAGHYWGYSARARVVERNHFPARSLACWALPLVPVAPELKALARKAVSAVRWSEEGAFGFASGSPLVNRCLARLARCEPVPRRICGTPLMAVAEGPMKADLS